MIYIVPTSDKNHGAFMDGSLVGDKSRVKVASLEVTSKSNDLYLQSRTEGGAETWIAKLYTPFNWELYSRKTEDEEEDIQAVAPSP